MVLYILVVCIEMQWLIVILPFFHPHKSGAMFPYAVVCVSVLNPI